MFARGLKAKMAITIAVLLFVAMVLIDLVIVVTTQNEFIRSEVSKGDVLLARLEDDLLDTCLWENIGSHSASKAKIVNMLNEAGVSCALIMGRDAGELCFGEKQCPAQKKLVGFTRQAILSGKKTVNFSGKIWGIFWKQNRNLIISLPLFQNRTPVAGASIVLPLEGIYERLSAASKSATRQKVRSMCPHSVRQWSKLDIEPLHRSSPYWCLFLLPGTAAVGKGR